MDRYFKFTKKRVGSDKVIFHLLSLYQNLIGQDDLLRVINSVSLYNYQYQLAFKLNTLSREGGNSKFPRMVSIVIDLSFPVIDSVIVESPF